MCEYQTDVILLECFWKFLFTFQDNFKLNYSFLLTFNGKIKRIFLKTLINFLIKHFRNSHSYEKYKFTTF